MNHLPFLVIAAITLTACTKPDTPVAPPMPVPVAQASAPSVPVAATAQTSDAKATTSQERAHEPDPVEKKEEPPKLAEPKPAKSGDDCEAVATSKEGRAAVMRFAEGDLKEIIARRAMETFPVPARLQITGLLSSGEVKTTEKYELIYTPVAAELVRETEKGVICRVSTEFHADGTIAYTGEGNDGTTKVKEAPAKLDAKRDLYLKTTKRLDGGTQIEVVAL